MTDASEPTRGGGGGGAGVRLAWAGLACVIALSLLRAMVEHDPFPWWQTDPFVFSPPVIGLTPRWILLLNMGLMASSAATVLGLVWSRAVIDPLRSLFLLIGLAAIGFHAATNIETVIDSSNLAAIVCVLYAASCAHKLEHARRVIAAAGLGFVLMLVFMGLHEVFVTHPQTVANYEQTRESFLGARGWSEDSFETRSYERRLYQAEPIAWFGLTNVFASFCGAGAVGWLALAWLWPKDGRGRWLRLGRLLCGLLCCVGLVLTGAKGGMGAAVLGAGITAGALLVPRWRLSGRAIVAACGVVLLGVVFRGLIGERLGELSLLFRWQYMVGSVRMWLAEPLLGVGPGMFQDYYAMYKPALSPEDVASAHSLPLDLLATLGLGGVALIALFVRTLLDIRPESAGGTPDENASSIGQHGAVRVVLLTVAFAALISLRMNLPVMDGTMILIYLAGCGLWGVAAALVVLRDLPERVVGWALFAAACVLSIHAMIEVTATWFVSGALWALIVGAASTDRQPRGGQDGAKGQTVLPILAVLGMLTVAGITAGRWPTINAWERELHASARSAARIAQIRQDLNTLEFGGDPDRVLRETADELALMLGMRVEASFDGVAPALNQVEFEQRQAAIERLELAIRAFPAHTPTRVAASQQMLWVASVLSSLGREEQAGEYWDMAIGLFDSIDLDAGGHRWAASMLHGRAMRYPRSPDRDQWLAGADLHLRTAMEMTPHHPHTAYRLMDLAVERGLDEEAADWARRALQLHEQSRLDPLRGLGEAEESRARSLAE